MSRLETMRCWSCDKEVEVWVSGFNHRRVCPKCEALENLKIKTEHLDELKKMPLEERIAKIEEWMYDHSHGNLHSINVNDMPVGGRNG